MSGPRWLVLRLAAALAVVLAPALAVQAPAGAAGQRCAPGKGVTVVVDYGALRGGIDLHCAPSGGGGTAFDIMREAGVSWQNVSGQPFVCRIQSYPQDETCSRIPPANAYWGLFWSDGSPQTWRYSSQGGASLRVPNGGSVGWRWQDGGARDDPGAPPTQKPAAAPSPRPSPKPSPRPSAKPSPKPAAKPSSAPATATKPQRPASAPATTASSSSGRAQGEQDASAAAARLSDKPSGTPSRRAQERREGGVQKAAAKAQRDRVPDDQAPGTSPGEEYLAEDAVEEPVSTTSGSSGGGSPTAGLVALALLGALGAAGLLIARRRGTG